MEWIYTLTKVSGPGSLGNENERKKELAIFLNSCSGIPWSFPWICGA
jgi:hypothetical protein